MLIENEVLNVKVNEVLNVKVVEEQKSNAMLTKFGDFCLGLALAALAAIFAEYVLKSETGIGIERVALCASAALLMIISSVVFYKKGGA